MEYPKITQITHIPAWTSGRAKTTAKAVAVSQERPCLSRAPGNQRSTIGPNRRAAKRCLYRAGGNQPSAEICEICVICGS
jgi:hypothetical protein